MNVSIIRLQSAINGRSPLSELPKPDEALAARKAAGIRRADLAALIGVTEMTLCRWERGVNVPGNVLFAARWSRAVEFLRRQLAKQWTRATLVGAAA